MGVTPRPTVDELVARVRDALNLVMSNNALYVELADAALSELTARAKEAEEALAGQLRITQSVYDLLVKALRERNDARSTPPASDIERIESEPGVC